ncbi:MAG TPA: 50S ribosomal protein L4 [Candidatus Omnitrophota bacterium]|nr:50S ribosomal protein L4 [Candidatus Omnitrophota bacterium]
MEAITLPIYNSDGKEVDEVKLSAKVFDGSINNASLYQAVNAYKDNQRLGLAATKTRGEVSGGGRKPWKQKGTGRARVGSTRSPLWRHGGVVFGPHPRDFSHSLPQKIKALALKSSLNIKAKEKNLVVLDSFQIKTHKTKEALGLLGNLKAVPGTHKRLNAVLLLVDKLDNNLKLATRNINFLKVNLSRDTHAYEVLKFKKLIITKAGLTDLIKRFNS